MTACRHSIAYGILKEKTNMEYFYKETLRKIREVVNILHLYHFVIYEYLAAVAILRHLDPADPLHLIYDLFWFYQTV